MMRNLGESTNWAQTVRMEKLKSRIPKSSGFTWVGFRRDGYHSSHRPLGSWEFNCVNNGRESSDGNLGQQLSFRSICAACRFVTVRQQSGHRKKRIRTKACMHVDKNDA